MIQEWYELKDLLGVGGLATTVQGITKKAKNEGWERRRKEGVKGKVFEYHYTSLPLSVQAQLGFMPQAPARPKNGLNLLKDYDELVQVPCFNTFASAGFGAINDEPDAPDDHIALSAQWLYKRGLPRHHLCFIYARGDSMWPTIHNGDLILINRASIQPKDGYIYVIRTGEQLWVKRVQGIIGGLRFISDNKSLYSPIDVIFDDGTDLQIIGQVVFVGHDLI